MKYFSTFSGVGGFEIGLPKDWECVGHSEIDKYASQVLAYHYPNVKNYGDISTIDWKQVPDFDVLIGGSPCQDFSIAGKRRGLAGAKSSLAWEYIRGLRSKQPRHFIWENVKGVMSSRGGWDFANLLTAFSESGYALWWQVLNAKDFGVPQNRERIFVVGTRGDSTKEVFFESEDSGQIEIVGTTKGDENTRFGQHDHIYSPNGIGCSLGAVDYKQPVQILVMNNSNHQNLRVYNPLGISPALDTAQGGHKTPKIKIHNMQPRSADRPSLKYSSDGSGHLSRTDGKTYTLDTGNTNAVEIGNQVRKLMPIECERLMSWPDDWTKFGSEGEISDSQRYKMCGNGVVSNVVKEIVKNLL